MSVLSRPLVGFAVASVAGAHVEMAPWPALLVVVSWTLLLGWGGRGGEARALARRWIVLLVFGVFVVSAARVELRLARHTEQLVTVADSLLGPRRCEFEGVVERSPVVRTLDGPEGGLGPVWFARTSELSCEERRIAPGGEMLVRLTRGPTSLVRGARVRVIGQLGPTASLRNAALVSPAGFAARRGDVVSGTALDVEVIRPGVGAGALVDRARGHVRARILATYRPLAAPLGRALVLGESDLDPGDAGAFQRSGLLHLLAVSGTHLVIAVVSITAALRALLVRVGPLARRYDVTRVAALVGALASVAYADFAGGSGSAWRAAYMLCLVSGARLLGRRLSGVSALAGSLVVGSALDPLAGSDVSFLLSALATVGLLLIGQPLARRLFASRLGHVLDRPIVRPIAESVAATLASTLPCSPVLAAIDGRMTLAALLANVVAGPLGELLALPACLVHALSSPLPALERGLAMVGSGALVLVRAVALASAGAEALQFRVPFPSGLLVSSVMAAVFACARCGGWGLSAVPRTVWAWVVRSWGARRRLVLARAASAAWRAGAVALLLSGCGLLLGPLQPPPVRERSSAPALAHADARARPSTTAAASQAVGRLTVTVLDVGQGDALVVEFPSGAIALVDGGGVPGSSLDLGTRVLLPYLRARGRDALDLVVLSHAHPDHLLGLPSVAEAVPVRELWHPAPPRPGGDHERLVAAVLRAGGRVRSAPELCRTFGERRPLFGARVAVLWPCEVPGAARLEFDELSMNDGSLVLGVEHGHRRALLTGDIEAHAEATLGAAPHAAERLRADLLKVAHHGSETSSSSAFLALVRPGVAFISAGIRNRFDHPRRSAVHRLRAAGAQVLRTDVSGSLTWSTDGENVEVRAYLPPERLRRTPRR